MKGEKKVVAGVKNKLYDIASNVLPDSAKASSMEKQMQPSEKSDGRSRITHAPSAEERDQIIRATGKPDGDYNIHEDHIHDDKES